MSATVLLSTLSLLGAQPDPSAVNLALAEQAAPADPMAASAAPAEAVPSPEATPINEAPPATPESIGPVRHAEGDPLEGFNRAMFSLNQSFDKAILRPAAAGYKQIVPKPARSGIRNVFANLNEPVVFLNDILQLKPKSAARTLLRTLINTIFGIGGLIDVGKHEGLPHRSNGLGNTLGRYGVKPGPYLFLPLFGPNTLRDTAGWQVDRLLLPLAVGKPFNQLSYQISTGVVAGLDARAEYDAELKSLFNSALDPYATLRSVYLQSRAAEISALTGKGEAEPDGSFDDPLSDPAAVPAEPGAAPAPAQ